MCTMIARLLIVISLLQSAAFAQPRIASIFTSNMVLQQQATVPIWGWTDANKKVSVTTSWNRKKYVAVADATGKWRSSITTPKAGGPYYISISDGKEVKLSNVLIGEVWLCTGQSNMEMPMKGFKGQPINGSNDAILHATNPNIRIYTVPRSSVTEKQQNSKASDWKEATPESISNFSATGYYFGKLISELTGVPIGLVNCSFSGSYAQAWMSSETLKDFPAIKIPSKTDTIKEVSRTPTTLYNGMLHPITGFGIKGIIYYQGESNYDDPDLYEKLFPAMVKQWRTEWNNDSLPFLFAQIAPYNYAQLPPYRVGGKFNSAYLRDAQRKSEDVIPHSAMAVLMDAGEEKSIHPASKETAGKRLALLALGKSYGIKGFDYESPAYDSIIITGSTAEVKFKKASNWLTSYGKEMTTFEIAGKDKIFYPAKAFINRSSVIVSAPQVRDPIAVRYAFKDFVVGELFSTGGLPVSSFRTDNW